MSITQPLSKPVIEFLRSVQDKDAALLEACFDLHAVMVDEGITYKGRSTIVSWGVNALFNHNATISVQKGNQNGDDVYLEVIMDGDFEESYGITEPFTLYFKAKTTPSAIQTLIITDLDPQAPSMFAVWANKGNPSDPLSSLRLSHRAVPTVPDGWVKVNVSAAAINWHDIFTLMGVGRKPLTFPRILGCEACGTLDDGTEVVLYPIMGDPHYHGDITLDPNRHAISEEVHSTLAEYVVVPRENAIPRPKNLPVMSAVVLGIAWLTAYRMLFTRSGLRAGQKMLVQGSSGGVPTALIQLASAAGMRVWTTGRTQEKRNLALKLGAERTFLPGEDLPEYVDAVFDTSGDATWAHSMKWVKPGGTVVTSGIHSGGSVSFDLMRLFVEQIDIRGVYAGTLDEFQDLISFVTAKGIVPHVGQVLPMNQAGEGLKNLMDGKTMGKVVLTL